MKNQTTPAGKLLTVLTWGLVALTIILTVASWGSLPEMVPTHYDVSGAVDAYGGKMTVWLVPACSVGCCALMEFCARMRPDKINIPVKIRPGKETESYSVMRIMAHWLNVEAAVVFLILQLATLFNRPLLTNGMYLVLFLMALTVALACLKVKRINRAEE